MHIPNVSVVMPVYNSARYVGAAIESILNQEYSDFEFIIINDGSTDGSLEILQGYALHDRRIRLVSRPNTGYTRALNDGLALASGEYVARMDADDVGLPGRFSHQLHYFDLHPDSIAVGTAMVMTDPKGRALGVWNMPTEHDTIDQFHLERCGSAIAHPTAMIKREALTRVGGYRPELEPAEDLDLWLRLAEVGRLGNVPARLLRYRLHESSVSASRRRQQVANSYRAVNDARERRGLQRMAFTPPQYMAEKDEVGHIRWANLAYRNQYFLTSLKNAGAHLLRHPLSMQMWRRCAAASFRLIQSTSTDLSSEKGSGIARGARGATDAAYSG